MQLKSLYDILLIYLYIYKFHKISIVNKFTKLNMHELVLYITYIIYYEKEWNMNI